MKPDMTVDAGFQGLPFPMRVPSRANREGQATVADISISARIRGVHEGEWIHQIMRILHEHRDRIGVSTLRINIMDYLLQLDADMVRVDFKYPFFIEKLTPVSREKCLVCYPCSYSARVPSVTGSPRIFFSVTVPVLTSFPAPALYGYNSPPTQVSRLEIETESLVDIFPEDLVALADTHALSPVYSFLTSEDQAYVIDRLATQRKDVETVIEGISNELSRNRSLASYAIRSHSGATLFSYDTLLSADKRMLVPASLMDFCEV
jgi:GTP cyclohydrolase IB